MRMNPYFAFLSVATLISGCHKDSVKIDEQSPNEAPGEHQSLRPENNCNPVGEVKELTIPGSTKTVKVQGSIFCGGNKAGDFGWMIERKEYANSLFVFNDNEEQFLAFRKGDRGESGCGEGGNNAKIRKYQCRIPPRAAGVPTGWQGEGGYTALDKPTKAHIDRALTDIRNLVLPGTYDTIIFSQNKNKKTLGAGIFSPAPEVKDYIFNGLMNLF
jgi:hypothetical protein